MVSRNTLMSHPPLELEDWYDTHQSFYGQKKFQGSNVNLKRTTPALEVSLS
jgi:hypothetical protein